MVQSHTLSKEEATQLQELKTATDAIILELGELSLQKIGLEIRESKLKKRVEELAKKEEIITEALNKKYGSIVVDLENSTFTSTSTQISQ